MDSSLFVLHSSFFMRLVAYALSTSRIPTCDYSHTLMRLIAYAYECMPVRK